MYLKIQKANTRVKKLGRHLTKDRVPQGGGLILPCGFSIHWVTDRVKSAMSDSWD